MAAPAAGGPVRPPAGLRLLAIDTSAEDCAVAVRAGAASPVLRVETVGRGHGERLLGMIAAALDAAGLRPGDLDRIGVTVGPGSFTGVRIGLAAARGLALATGAPAVGLTTLEAHAEALRDRLDGRPLLVALDARAGGIYGQAFAPDLGPLDEPGAGAPEAFARSAAALGARLAGSGARRIAAALGPGADGLILTERAAPDIAAVLRLVARAVPLSTPPRPLYLRPPDAVPSAAAAVARR